MQDEALYREWIGTVEFEYPGTYNLWYKASADGVNLSNAFSDANKPAIVKRPQIIELGYGEALAGEPLAIDVTTSKDVVKLYMYQGEELLGEWSREETQIESFETCDTWHLSYTFEEAGEKYLWYKASEDGETQGNAFPFDPVIIGKTEEDEGIAIDEINFPDAAFRGAVTTFDANQSGILSEEELTDATVLDCSNLGIQSLQGIELLCALVELNCAGNALETVDLSQNTQLQALICKDNADLKTVTLPVGMTTITDYAFQNCTALGYMYLPASVTAIGAYAFQNCTSLETVELSDAVSSIGVGAFKGGAPTLVP